MKIAAVLAALAATVWASSPTVSELVKPRQAASAPLPTITVKGNAFFAGDTRFYLRGVAYQPGGAANASDPLLNIPDLTRDIKLFKELGINCIRIYTVDNSKSHEEGMKLLEDAGIYLVLDVNTPDFSLNRESNATLFKSYNEKYLQSVFATIDKFAGYNNLLMMINGNEVINDRNNTIAAPYIKALHRDMKAYISARKYRNIPVGYAAADVAENIDQQLAYFDCGPEGVRGDFFALNDYSWCSPSSFTLSGWDKKVQKLKGYGAPLVMAEFGCITNKRDWGEIAALFDKNMTSVYSGGLAYEFTVEPNGYGIVEVDGDTIKPNEDFDRLAAAFKKTPNPTGDGGYSPNVTASKCPSFGPDWAVPDDNIPAMPELAQKYMKDGAGQGPGIGKDVTPSQWGGESYSPGWVAPDGSAAVFNGNGGTGSGNGQSTGSGSGSKSGSSGNGSSAAVAIMPPFKGLVTVAGLLAGLGLAL